MDTVVLWRTLLRDAQQGRVQAGNRQQHVLRRARREIAAIVAEHASTLARRRMALVSVEADGTIDIRPWVAECRRFVAEVILPKLTDEEARAVAQAGPDDLMVEVLRPAMEQDLAARLVQSLLSPANDTTPAPTSGSPS